MNYSNPNIEDEFTAGIDGDVREFVATSSIQNITNSSTSNADGSDDFYGIDSKVSKRSVKKYGSKDEAQYQKGLKKYNRKEKRKGLFDKVLQFGKDAILKSGGSPQKESRDVQEIAPPQDEIRTRPEGMSMGVKIAIGVGVLAVLGGIVYFATKKK